MRTHCVQNILSNAVAFATSAVTMAVTLKEVYGGNSSGGADGAPTAAIATAARALAGGNTDDVPMLSVTIRVCGGQALKGKLSLWRMIALASALPDVPSRMFARTLALTCSLTQSLTHPHTFTHSLTHTLIG